MTPYALDATRHAERGREQPGRLGGDRASASTQHQERADRHRRADRPAAAVAEPVEERPDQRRHDRERQHRQAEEQRHLAAGLARRDLEEQRAGQRDRHGGVAGGVEGVHLDQPGEARSASAPSALAARRACRRVNRPARPVPARDARRPRLPVTRAPVPSGSADLRGLLAAAWPARGRWSARRARGGHAPILPRSAGPDLTGDAPMGDDGAGDDDGARQAGRRGRGRGRPGARRPARRRRRRRRRRAPRRRRRGRARRHPPVRLHPPRVRRLALVGDRGPGEPPEDRHRRRGRADPGRRGDRGARSGCPTASASSPATSRPATCCPWPTTTRAWSRRTPSATTRSTPTRRRRSATSPTSSASAASAPSRWRAATSPPSAGTTATAAPSPRSPRRPPTPARSCGFLVRIAGAAGRLLRRLRQRRRQRRRPGRLLRPRLRRPLRGTAGPQARAPAPPRAGARHPHRRRVRASEPAESVRPLDQSGTGGPRRGRPCGGGSTRGRRGRGRSRPGRSTATRCGRRRRGRPRRGAGRGRSRNQIAEADLDGADAVDVEGLDVGHDVGAVADLVLDRLGWQLHEGNASPARSHQETRRRESLAQVMSYANDMPTVENVARTDAGLASELRVSVMRLRRRLAVERHPDNDAQHRARWRCSAACSATAT